MSPETRATLALRLTSKEGLPLRPPPGGALEGSSVLEFLGLSTDREQALRDAMASAFVAAAVVEREETATIGRMDYRRARWHVGRPEVFAFAVRSMVLPEEAPEAEEALAAMGIASTLHAIRSVRL